MFICLAKGTTQSVETAIDNKKTLKRSSKIYIKFIKIGFGITTYS
jgi:hypothetical protein